MIVVTDLLRLPFDEGAKNTAYNIISSFDPTVSQKIISVNGDKGVIAGIEICKVNKAFIDIQFLTNLRALSYGTILYLPESSATVLSIIRSKLLKVFTGKDVYILALQPREHYGFKRLLVRLIAPKMIITPSVSYAEHLREAGLDCIYIPLGVNDKIYRQYDKNERIEIRRKFNIASGKTVLLHVGHICKSRNLEWLIEVKRQCPDIEIVLVGSSYNESDFELHDDLKSHGIIVINQYIENMAEIYNLANYYVFPVVDDQGAIATPLSVLEAMSCNVPIMTTRFGSLVDMFKADRDFHFIDDSDDIISVFREGDDTLSECTNRQKIECYSWKNIANRIVSIVGQ